MCSTKTCYNGECCEHVSGEMETELGDKIGHAIWFEDVTGINTLNQGNYHIHY